MKWSRYTPIKQRLECNSIPEPNNGCHLWLGKVNQHGYGMIKKNGKEYRAHRIAYSLKNPNENIDNKVICHKCDVPSCINPDHLFSGTQTDNLSDMTKKGRRKGGAPLGNKNGLGNKSKTAMRALCKS